MALKAAILGLFLSLGEAAYSSFDLTEGTAAAVVWTGAGDCRIGKITIATDQKLTSLQFTVKTTADSALSYMAFTFPEARGTTLFNSPADIFSSNSTCWAATTDIGTAGLRDASNANKGGASPTFVDLAATDSETGKGGATSGEYVTDSSCNLAAGDYYIIIYGSAAVSGTVKATTGKAPAVMCTGSDENTLVIILGSVFGVLGFVCILALIWRCFCREEAEASAQTSETKKTGGNVEMHNHKYKDPEDPAEKKATSTAKKTGGAALVNAYSNKYAAAPPTPL